VPQQASLRRCKERCILCNSAIRIDPEHHTCQESKGIVQERLQEVEARIAELQSMQRSLQRLNDACCGTAHSSVYCSILEALEQGASGVKSGC
ncbi:MerR family DNA-binding protein, partial [Escherichia sp. R-CC3]